MKRIVYLNLAVCLSLLVSAHMKAEQSAQTFYMPDDVLAVIQSVKSHHTGETPAREFDSLVTQLDAQKNEVPYADVFMGLTEALELLEKNEVRLSQDAVNSGVETLQKYLQDITVKRSCFGPCVGTACPVINVCPPPCKPCDPRLPSPCLITGCFSLGTPVDPQAPAPVIGQAGCNFIITRNGFNYLVTLTDPLCAMMSVVVTSNGQQGPCDYANPLQNPLLVGVPSNRQFTLTNLSPNTTYCFLAVPIT